MMVDVHWSSHSIISFLFFHRHHNLEEVEETNRDEKLGGEKKISCSIPLVTLVLLLWLLGLYYYRPKPRVNFDLWLHFFHMISPTIYCGILFYIFVSKLDICRIFYYLSLTAHAFLWLMITAWSCMNPIWNNNLGNSFCTGFVTIDGLIDISLVFMWSFQFQFIFYMNRKLELVLQFFKVVTGYISTRLGRRDRQVDFFYNR